MRVEVTHEVAIAALGDMRAAKDCTMSSEGRTGGLPKKHASAVLLMRRNRECDFETTNLGFVAPGPGGAERVFRDVFPLPPRLGAARCPRPRWSAR